MGSSTMDTFSEPYTRACDDTSLEEVRRQVRELEDLHRENGIPLSGRIIHVCHYLPVIAALNSRAGVLSPPATPPTKVSNVPTTPTDDEQRAPDGLASAAQDSSALWTLTPRYGHAAMISGIRSLSATHEQVIVGWTGDIASSIPNENIPASTIPEAERATLAEALSTYQPKESDPDDDKKTVYVPVWLDDKVAHGHYDGYCKQSESFRLSAREQRSFCSSPLASIPLSPLAGCCNRIRFGRLPLPLLRIRQCHLCSSHRRNLPAWRSHLGP